MFDAYADTAQADAHHAVRPTSAAWAALGAADKAARLVAASDYLDAAYRFKGRKTRPDQTRQFPRNGQTVIPPEMSFRNAAMRLGCISVSARAGKTTADRN